MLNTLWLFGDSFTAGHGIYPDSIYAKKYGPGKTFDVLLGEYFNLEVINQGVSGCSNYTIIAKLVSNLNNIREGDMVIVGNTSPLRGLIPNKEGTSLIDQKLFDTSPTPDSIAYGNDRLEQILREYCIEFYKDFIPLWNSYFTGLILGILKKLETGNITTLLWDYSVWSEEESKGMKFENILKHTNGEIYDLHWSYNGHKEVFKWLKDGINQGKKLLK